MQAKNISDDQIKDLINSAGGVCCISDIQKNLGTYPPKLVRAKIYQMVNKGRLIGRTDGTDALLSIPIPVMEGQDARVSNSL